MCVCTHMNNVLLKYFIKHFQSSNHFSDKCRSSFSTHLRCVQHCILRLELAGQSSRDVSRP